MTKPSSTEEKKVSKSVTPAERALAILMSRSTTALTATSEAASKAQGKTPQPDQHKQYYVIRSV